jgi:hypothetical protein
MKLNAFSAAVETIRYALGSNARTARLTTLVVAMILAWHVTL